MSSVFSLVVLFLWQNKSTRNFAHHVYVYIVNITGETRGTVRLSSLAGGTFHDICETYLTSTPVFLHCLPKLFVDNVKVSHWNNGHRLQIAPLSQRRNDFPMVFPSHKFSSSNMSDYFASCPRTYLHYIAKYSLHYITRFVDSFNLLVGQSWRQLCTALLVTLANIIYT